MYRLSIICNICYTVKSSFVGTKTGISVSLTDVLGSAVVEPKTSVPDVVNDETSSDCPIVTVAVLTQFLNASVPLQLLHCPELIVMLDHSLHPSNAFALIVVSAEPK